VLELQGVKYEQETDSAQGPNHRQQYAQLLEEEKMLKHAKFEVSEDVGDYYNGQVAHYQYLRDTYPTKALWDSQED
jgi:hypothetical protein